MIWLRMLKVNSLQTILFCAYDGKSSGSYLGAYISKSHRCGCGEKCERWLRVGLDWILEMENLGQYC